MAAHYESLFSNDPATAELREAYAMKNDTVPDAEHRRALTAFFWWTAWATVTERPGSDITYTNNWPSEPLVGNTPPASLFLWSAFSVILPEAYAEGRGGMELGHDAQIGRGAELNGQFRDDFGVQFHGQPKSRSAASTT